MPTGSGRDVCQRWMRGQWLVRSLDESGQEVYTLTSHAQQALELVKTLSRDRATLSEHRVATILNTVRRFNGEANPDRTRPGRRILNAEIARLRRRARPARRRRGAGARRPRTTCWRASPSCSC